MDRLLMRHDDVNTFGIVLYSDITAMTPTLYHDSDCTTEVTFEEAQTLLPKVALIRDCYVPNNTAKIVAMRGDDDSGQICILGVRIKMHSGVYEGAEFINFTIYKKY